jgi:hypothetical protein
MLVMAIMRPRNVMTVMIALALGLAAYAIIRRVRRRQRGALGDDDAARAGRAAQAAGAGGCVPDAGDPVQGLYEVIELEATPLDVDAVSRRDAEAAQDLAVLEAELAEESDVVIITAEADPEAFDGETELRSLGALGSEDRIARAAGADGADDDLDAVPDGARGDAGDLYGAHTPAAVDRTHPDDDHAFAEGQNWLEALETSAIENGAEPDRELDDIVDDEDVLRPPHAALARDTPVADHGAGGRRGL